MSWEGGGDLSLTVKAGSRSSHGGKGLTGRNGVESAGDFNHLKIRRDAIDSWHFFYSASLAPGSRVANQCALQLRLETRVELKISRRVG